MPRTRLSRLVAGLFLSAGATLPALALAMTEVDFQHQLDRSRGEKLAALVEAFNSQSKDYRIRLVPPSADGVPAVLNLAAPEQAAAPSRYRPLHKVMAEAREKFDGKQLAPELRAPVVDAKGNLNALPLAMSTPVLYYNKAAFRKAGLDPDKPPKTWPEMQEAAGKLFDSGLRCPYTSSWPAWVHIDNTSALNGGDVATAKGQLAFNGLVQVKHVALLASWYKSYYFHYFGRRDEADRHFAAGECGMLTSGSAVAVSLRESPLDIGVAALPYYDDVRGAPQHTLADGASLWIGEGKKPAEYKAAASFVQFLLNPDSQVELSRLGGYLPMTALGRAAASSKLQAGEPAGGALQAAYGQLKKDGAAPPLRVSQIEAVRSIVDEELEAVWAGKKPAKEALDVAVARGNVALAAANLNAAPAEKAKPAARRK